jgi:DNA-binding CsgD family transcriptional regulator
VRTRRAAGRVRAQVPQPAESPPARPALPAAPGVDPERLASLSPRETEVLRHLLEGYRVNTIARRLFISQHTVRNHLKKIFAKLEVRSQTELMERLKP